MATRRSGAWPVKLRGHQSMLETLKSYSAPMVATAPFPLLSGPRNLLTMSRAPCVKSIAPPDAVADRGGVHEVVEPAGDAELSPGDALPAHLAEVGVEPAVLVDRRAEERGRYWRSSVP